MGSPDMDSHPHTRDSSAPSSSNDVTALCSELHLSSLHSHITDEAHKLPSYIEVEGVRSTEDDIMRREAEVIDTLHAVYTREDELARAMEDLCKAGETDQGMMTASEGGAEGSDVASLLDDAEATSGGVRRSEVEAPETIIQRLEQEVAMLRSETDRLKESLRVAEGNKAAAVAKLNMKRREAEQLKINWKKAVHCCERLVTEMDEKEAERKQAVRDLEQQYQRSLDTLEERVMDKLYSEYDDRLEALERDLVLHPRTPSAENRKISVLRHAVRTQREMAVAERMGVLLIAEGAERAGVLAAEVAERTALLSSTASPACCDGVAALTAFLQRLADNAHSLVRQPIWPAPLDYNTVDMPPKTSQAEEDCIGAPPQDAVRNYLGKHFASRHVLRSLSCPVSHPPTRRASYRKLLPSEEPALSLVSEGLSALQETDDEVAELETTSFGATETATLLMSEREDDHVPVAGVVWHDSCTPITAPETPPTVPTSPQPMLLNTLVSPPRPLHWDGRDVVPDRPTPGVSSEAVSSPSQSTLTSILAWGWPAAAPAALDDCIGSRFTSIP